ncbi:MAG: esterase-like activity of phytase family protein [Candidatus Binatia bacterium]
MSPGFIAALSIFFFLSCGLGSMPSEAENHPVVNAIPIKPDPETPSGKRLGRLTFLSGFELQSADPRFGGLSGLALSAHGTVLYAVSDRGYWLSAHLHHDDAGHLTALDHWTIGPLLTSEGAVVHGRLRDAEALARDRDGSFIVSFENVHRLWRYPPLPTAFNSPAQHLPAPADLERAPSNGGLEAVTVLPDGRLLALTEQYKNPDGSLRGWLIEKQQFATIAYLASDDFQPTDLESLPSGNVLLLERRYSFVNGAQIRIQWLPRESLRTGARLKGKEIARLEPPLPVDNFEGMAVQEDPVAGTLVYLVSDDNYSSFQRTLLLQFRLETIKGN